MSPTLIEDREAGNADEKTPLIYHGRPKQRSIGTRRRILCFLLIFALLFALTRRLTQYTSSWVCLSASRYLLYSSTACTLPSWYDIPSSASLASHKNVSNEIPQYVLDYAPLVHLFSDEKFWPCDMTEHLNHTTPELNYDPIDLNADTPFNLSLSNLDLLNEYDESGGRYVFLTSDTDVSTRPSWLVGEKNKPTPFTYRPRSARNAQNHPSNNTRGGRSSAPSVLILVPKGPNILDAFYFFFYSFNHGNEVLRLRFGNHVGDWEHTMIRFEDGHPKAVFFSEHNFGSAYTYSSVEKIGGRPVLYSATGTHAMYATPGLQPYVLPLGLLHDRTDRGPVWDPRENLISYTYDHVGDKLRPSTRNPDAPTNWFYFAGHWGDKHYPLSDSRQYGFIGEYHYVNGPLGPRFKHLGRRKVCQGPYEERCELRHWVGGGQLRVGMPKGEGEDWPRDGDVLPPGLRR